MNPPTETIDLGDGYQAEIAYDLTPENPFKAWDGEPPIVVAYDRHIDHYGDEELDVGTFLDLIPRSKFLRKASREEIREALQLDQSAVDYWIEGYDKRRPDSWLNCFHEALCYETSLRLNSNYGNYSESFDAMEALAEIAGVPCYRGTSTGYCQSHWSEVFVAATPKWAKFVGAPPESHANQCKNAFDLYGYWAWGDVYGVMEMTDPDGKEIPDSSCRGYYGPDHDANGILDHCRAMKAWWQTQREKESCEAHAMACRDIVTV